MSTGLRDASNTSEPAPRGRFLLFEAGAADATGTVRQAVADVYHVNVRSPRVLVAGADGLAPDVWMSMKDAGFRCGVLSRTPTIEMLRGAVCGVDEFGTDMLRWLVRANIASKPQILDYFAITLGDVAGTIGANAAAARGASRSVRRAFTNAGLASPGVWRSALRMVRIAVSAQADPLRTAASIAASNGQFDDAGLRRAFAFWFGCSLTAVRTNLGWEWLLWAAIERRGLVRGGGG